MPHPGGRDFRVKQIPDNQQVGIKAIQTSSYRASFSNAVPIGKREVVFRAKHKHGSEITHPVSTNTSLGNHNTEEQSMQG